LVLAGVGVFVGAFAYGATQFLILPLDYGLAREIESTTLPQALYVGNEVPRASAFMAHFALLFAALRWWKPVDPLRRRRLSLWSVAVAVVSEWAIHQMLPIPQPAGMLIAGGIAIAVQMSSPWVNPRPKTVVRKASLAAVAAAMLVMSTVSMPVFAAEAPAEASETEAKSTELSVVPLDQTVYPSNRPDWIDHVPDDDASTDDDETMVVTSSPSETIQESLEELRLMKRAVAINTIESLVPRGQEFKSNLLDDDWIDQWLVSRTYEGKVTQGDMVLHEHAAELVFDEEARHEIHELWKRSQVNDRLGLLGLAGFGGLCLLVVSSIATSYLSRRVPLGTPRL